MKNSVLACVMAFSFFQVFSQSEPWTLEACIAQALENNISVKQSELDLENAAIDRLEAVGGLLPTLNGTASGTKSTGLSLNPTTNRLENVTLTSVSASVNAAVTLFDGLQNFRLLQRAKLSRLAAQYRLDKMKDDIALNVANAYLQVLLNKANLEVIVSQNEVTLEQYQRTRDLVEAGSLPQGDLLEIRAADADEKQKIALAENAVQISLISLAQLLLVKDYAGFDVADQSFEIIEGGIAGKDISEIIQQAKESRSEVKIAEKNVELAQKDLQLAKGSYYPTLSMFFGYNTRYADNDPFHRKFVEQLYRNDGIAYGLQLNVPMFNGFAARSRVNRNKINLKSTEYELEQTELDLESNVYQAYVDAQGALKAYLAAMAAVESQELAFQYAQDRFDVGISTAFDFNQAKQRLDNSKIELNRSKFDYIFKIKVLELYFGIPPSELKL